MSISTVESAGRREHRGLQDPEDGPQDKIGEKRGNPSFPRSVIVRLNLDDVLTLSSTFTPSVAIMRYHSPRWDHLGPNMTLSAGLSE